MSRSTRLVNLEPYTDEWWEWRHAANERSRIKNVLRQRAKAAVVERHRDEYEDELALLVLSDGVWAGP